MTDLPNIPPEMIQRIHDRLSGPPQHLEIKTERSIMDISRGEAIVCVIIAFAIGAMIGFSL